MSGDATLRRGMSGAAVERLQAQLGAAGYEVVVDGQFGPTTEAAVRAFQRAHELAVDGSAGPLTRAAIAALAALSARPTEAHRLRPGDIEAAARTLGVTPAVIRGVTSVESAGAGFMPDGRPRILFERHIMRRRLLDEGRDVAVLEARLPEIINQARGGYLGGGAEHDRLHLAKQIHRASAIESASWGLFQIMGMHWRTLGYESAEDWERSMNKSEGEHLTAFVRFVQADPVLREALQQQDWRRFAERYNGPGYAMNQYDTRLGTAVAREQRTA